MSSSATTRASSNDRPPVTLRRLWAGVLLAPSAWLLAELVGYYLASRSCEPLAGVPLEGTAHPAMTQVVLAVVLGLVAIVGLVVAIGNWRAAGPEGGDRWLASFGRAQFMAFGGMIESALFVLGIVFFALPPLFVSPCSVGR